MGCVCERITLLNAAHRDNKYDCESLFANLTDTRKRIIRDNWHTLRLNIERVGFNTFIDLFESYPELKQHFTLFKGKGLQGLHDVDLLRKHSLRIIATIDKCMINLDYPQLMVDNLMEIGGRHAQYSVPIEDVQCIFPHFLGAVKPYLEDQWCQDVIDSWTEFFNIMFTIMKEGMAKHKDRKP